MKAAKRNPATILARGKPSTQHRVRLLVGLLSFGTLSLGLLGLGHETVLSGPAEAIVLLSQAVSAGAVLGMIYRWVRFQRPQLGYVRIRA